MQPPPKSPNRSREDAQEQPAVVIIEEYVLARISATRNVPQSTRVLEAKWPSHH
jgi:hypothetical protein